MPRLRLLVSRMLQREGHRSIPSPRRSPTHPLSPFQVVTLINLEDRWLQLHKQRTDMIITRRQEDVKDQCTEYSMSKSIERQRRASTGLLLVKAAAFVNGTLPTNDFRTPLDPKRQRRATEREARR